MKQIVLTIGLAFALAVPVEAQTDDQTGAAPESEGFSLMEEGARLLFRGLMQEMEPAVRELDGISDKLEPALRGLVENMGPALDEFLEKVEDFSAYHPPEFLPNGDIILRRRAPEAPAPDTSDGETDL